MKLGLQTVRFNWPGSPENIGSKLGEIAQTADQAGFASLWLMDHYYQIAPMIGAADDPMLECYTALAHMAAHTKRAKLGVMVTGVIYREPAFLVKQVTTLDVLSGGRAMFGIGAAWYEEEARGLGFNYPSTSERFERLEEMLQIANHMFADDRSAYTGKHYQLPAPINQPVPLSQSHPPILIGGMGEKKTLRMVAQYADACNLFLFGGTDVIEHKLKVLQEHCDRLGRDFNEIEKTVLGGVDLSKQSPSEVIDQCGELAELGIEHYIFSMPDAHEIKPLETMATEIIPAVEAF